MKKINSCSFYSMLLSAVAVTGSANSAAASGIETSAGIAVSVNHSDNISRNTNVRQRVAVDNEKRSDLESQIRLDVGVIGTTAQFDIDLSYTFTAKDFKHNVETDDEVVDGDARILWTPLPERFAWELTNNVSDTVRNDRLADTPDNRQQRNIFSTGPTFTFRLSSVDLLRAELRYTDVTVKEDKNNDNEIEVDTDNVRRQGGDSERQVGRLRWTHRLSSVSELLLKAEYEDVQADAVDAANDGVAYTRLLGGYAARLRNGSYEILVGANKVEPKVGDDFDASVFQVAFTHDFGGHGINLTLLKEATDTSLGFGASNLRSDSFTPRDSNFDSFSIVERQRADIAYQNFLICGVCTIRASAFFDDQDDKGDQDRLSDQIFQIQTGDQRSYGFRFDLAYSLLSNLDLIANANYELVDFIDDPDELEYESTEYTIGIDYSLLRNFSIGLRVMQFSRDANIDVLDFDELRGGIDLSYRF